MNKTCCVWGAGGLNGQGAKIRGLNWISALRFSYGMWDNYEIIILPCLYVCFYITVIFIMIPHSFAI